MPIFPLLKELHEPFRLCRTKVNSKRSPRCRGEGDKPVTRFLRYYLLTISLLVVPALLRDADDKENRHLAGASVI